MAWRVGATLVNMEMQWWHTNDIADPPCWQRMQIYPNPMLGSQKSARMVNSLGEEFFNQQEDDPLAFGPYTVQLEALTKQVHAGKARYDGGYYAGFDHCDPAEVEAYTTYRKNIPATRPAISPTTGRNRRHLALPTGRHRCRYGDDAFVGARALRRWRRRRASQRFDWARDLRRQSGREIAAEFGELKSSLLPDSEYEAEIRRLDRLRSSPGSRISPVQLKEKLRTVMWEKVGVEKDAAGLRSALVDIEQIRLELLPDMKIANQTKTANFEWLDAIDVVNMVDACELIIHSSGTQREPRSVFSR